ncbi:Uncharacterised protein [Corynebacterium renale]|uniref:Uncharacterized protein n=2 Tax=Corynebacterium renale TaxID=1724 RepID=A0A2A9DKN1_9CORY|nr:hypothetical protein ATK06_0362 [Corynebacterium renale]SQI23607.1 Uncharacterised protein [Corynebacterium renale]
MREPTPTHINHLADPTSSPVVGGVWKNSTMTTHFWQSLGWLPDFDDNAALLDTVDVLAFDRVEDPVAGIARWAIYPDPSGANMGYFITADGTPASTFSLRSPYAVTAMATPLGVGIVEAELLDNEGETITKILVGVDDPMYFSTAGIAELRIGALADEVRVFDTVDEWRATQKPAVLDDGQEVYIGPGFIASPWLFELAGNSSAIDDANPIAVLNGECSAVELRTNKLTGKSWYYVEIDCGFPLSVALPGNVSPAPHVGSVIDGSAFLTASTGAWYHSI